LLEPRGEFCGIVQFDPAPTEAAKYTRERLQHRTYALRRVNAAVDRLIPVRTPAEKATVKNGGQSVLSVRPRRAQRPAAATNERFAKPNSRSPKGHPFMLAILAEIAPLETAVKPSGNWQYSLQPRARTEASRKA